MPVWRHCRGGWSSVTTTSCWRPIKNWRSPATCVSLGPPTTGTRGCWRTTTCTYLQHYSLYRRRCNLRPFVVRYNFRKKKKLDVPVKIGGELARPEGPRVGVGFLRGRNKLSSHLPAVGGRAIGSPTESGAEPQPTNGCLAFILSPQVGLCWKMRTCFCECWKAFIGVV